MTTPDPKTGLPILGAATDPSEKTVPIDLKLMPELREAEEKKGKSGDAAKMVGHQLVLLIATATAVGQAAFVDEKNWNDLVVKIATLQGIPKEKIIGTDIDKGVLLYRA